jgi:PAS domain S-box-containing protein
MKFVHPDDKERVADINRKNLYMAPIPYECKIVTSKGLIKDVLIQTKVVLGKFAEIEKTFGVVQDITERKQAEEKISAEKELFRLMIESMPDQIYLKDSESRFLLCNKPVTNGVGLERQEEMIGKTDFDFFPEDLAKQFLKEERFLMESGKSVINREGNIVDKSTGKIKWSLTTKVPLKNSSGKIIGLIGINRDITERKLDEELLKKSERVLETKNKELEIKNRELEQFAYVASHDLQEPLRTTTSFVEIFKKQYYGKIDAKADK